MNKVKSAFLLVPQAVFVVAMYTESPVLGGISLFVTLVCSAAVGFSLLVG